MSIKLATACAKVLRNRNRAIVTDYELWLIIGILFSRKELNGAPLRIVSSSPKKGHLSRVISDLSKEKLLIPDPDFGSHIYRFSDVPDHSTEELCCYVDPFCYISHLSAMIWHGFGDRNPARLMITTPEQRTWQQLALALQREETEGISFQSTSNVKKNRPQYKHPKRVRGRPISVHRTKYSAKIKSTRSPVARISTPGQTLVDSLLDPQLAGGMPYVISVWESEAKSHVNEIIEIVEEFPKPILKVRAGYILDERMELTNSTIQGWKKWVQRGGSRKLDPTKEYRSVWSTDWEISINI